jgi:hypothetical protein
MRRSASAAASSGSVSDVFSFDSDGMDLFSVSVVRSAGLSERRSVDRLLPGASRLGFGWLQSALHPHELTLAVPQDFQLTQLGLMADDALRHAHRRRAPRSHRQAMFLVTEADATAIRDVFEKEGELPAAIELRRRFPGITDNARARACVRTIAGWQPLPPKPERPRVVRLRTSDRR